MLAAIHIAWPDLEIDTLTVGLLLIASLPWLRPNIKSIELPGSYKVEVQELKKEVEERIQEQARKGRELTMHVGEEEHKRQELVQRMEQVEERVDNFVFTGGAIHLEEMSVADSILRISTQLLFRLALRFVDEFPPPPTIMASADFSPSLSRAPRIRRDNFPLTLAAFTWDCFDPLWTLLSHASSSHIPCLSTRFLFIESRLCAPASFPRSLALTQLPSASGSSGQRPQRTFTS